MKKLICAILIACFLAPACLADAMIANPWTETTAEELVQVLGLSFAVPEEAEEAVFRMLESESLAEMQFMWRGAQCTARIKPSVEFEDVSEIYLEWDEEEACEIGWCEGKILRADEENLQLCLWFDIVPGLMYSLSAEVLENVDVVELAGLVYAPAQGEVDGDF